jgi:hypothetical protein
MTAAKTLMQLAGIDLTPPRLGDSCLVLIDIQNEYLAGPLALPDASPAIARATGHGPENSGGCVLRNIAVDRPAVMQGYCSRWLRYCRRARGDVA